MSVDTQTELRIAQLDGTIQQLNAAAARIKKRRLLLEIEAAAATSRLLYLRFLKWFRMPAESYGLWRLGVLVVGSAAVGALTLILSDFFAQPFSVFGCSIAVVCAASVLAILLYYPGEAVLSSKITHAEIAVGRAKGRVSERKATDGLAHIENQIRQLLDERLNYTVKLREEIASGKRQRVALLQRNWKAMRGNEWEDYLLEVCRALGGKAERTGKCGDQGCDLIVQFDQTRIAVQAKGYYHVVNNKAVQEAVAGVAHYGCNSSAVITNSRFTRSARALAESNRCILIGEDEFPDFVMGRIQLFRLSQ